ncbi:hypothetical protein DER46DRAFT_515261, partial [Fusarium sp. MPI-SDFR-AT-0072]
KPFILSLKKKLSNLLLDYNAVLLDNLLIAFLASGNKSSLAPELRPPSPAIAASPLSRFPLPTPAQPTATISNNSNTDDLTHLIAKGNN